MHNVIDFIPRYYAFRLVHALSSPSFPSFFRLFPTFPYVSSIRNEKWIRLQLNIDVCPENSAGLEMGWSWKMHELEACYFFRCALFYDRKIVTVWGLGNKCR